jgi:hypothetical protein
MPRPAVSSAATSRKPAQDSSTREGSTTRSSVFTSAIAIGRDTAPYQPPTGAHTTNRASTATPCISSTSPCATRETARHAPALLEAQHADLATDMLVGRSRSQAAT